MLWAKCYLIQLLARFCYLRRGIIIEATKTKHAEDLRLNLFSFFARKRIIFGKQFAVIRRCKCQEKCNSSLTITHIYKGLHISGIHGK